MNPVDLMDGRKLVIRLAFEPGATFSEDMMRLEILDVLEEMFEENDTPCLAVEASWEEGLTLDAKRALITDWID